MLQAVVTLWLVVTFVFVATRVLGDPVNELLSLSATSQERAELRHELGLDRALALQYGSYMLALSRGDLGKSFRTKTPIATLIAGALQNSLLLALSAALLGFVVGIPLGIWSATTSSRWLKGAMVALALSGQALPSFWLSLVLILVFGVQLRILPTGGMGGPANLVLPSIALALFMIAGLMRLTRAALLEVLGSDYIKVARAKGLSEWRIVWIHALRNALIPPVTFSTVYFGLIVGSAVAVETIFSWPGMGRLAYDSITGRDFPVVQGVVLVVAALVVTINLLADLIHIWLDPKLQP